MKAVVKTPNGIALEEKMPPQLLASTDVILHVSLAGLCRTDSYAAQNKIPVAEGRVLGHEFTGTIAEMGPQVQGFQRGQRVAVLPLLGEKMLGIDLDGAYAEYVCVPASQIYPVPDFLSDQEAAFLEPIAASLAVCHTGILPTQKGLIYGANRIAELTDRILRIKGFQFIDRYDSEQQQEYDFIIETNPSAEAFKIMIQKLKPKGILVLKSRPSSSIPLPLADVVKKELQLIGAHYGDFAEGIQFVASGQLQIRDLFGATYSLSDAVPILLGEINVSEQNKLFFRP